MAYALSLSLTPDNPPLFFSEHLSKELKVEENETVLNFVFLNFKQLK